MNNKTWRADYNPNPFYFVEHNEEFSLSRIVAFTQNISQLKSLFIEILDHYPQELEVLYKVLCEKDFERFHCEIEKYKLRNAINKFEDFIFEDGSFQLCIKIPENDEYIALDEHGVLFIYSVDDFYISLLEKSSFISHKEDLIYSKPHYHHQLKDSEIFSRNFIEELGLEKVN